MKIVLQTELNDGTAVHKDGDIVELPDEQAQHLIDLGAATLSDGDVTTQHDDKGVDASTPPLDLSSASAQDGQPVQPEVSPVQTPEAEASNEQPTTDTTQASSETTSPNLHLG